MPLKLTAEIINAAIEGFGIKKASTPHNLCLAQAQCPDRELEKYGDSSGTRWLVRRSDRRVH